MDRARRLFDIAMRAFSETDRIAETHPEPGTPEWDRWHQLSDEALEANEAYMREIAKTESATAIDAAVNLASRPPESA